MSLIAGRSVGFSTRPSPGDGHLPPVGTVVVTTVVVVTTLVCGMVPLILSRAFVEKSAFTICSAGSAVTYPWPLLRYQVLSETATKEPSSRFPSTVYTTTSGRCFGKYHAYTPRARIAADNEATSVLASVQRKRRPTVVTTTAAIAALTRSYRSARMVPISKPAKYTRGAARAAPRIRGSCVGRL